MSHPLELELAAFVTHQTRVLGAELSGPLAEQEVLLIAELSLQYNQTAPVELWWLVQSVKWKELQMGLWH